VAQGEGKETIAEEGRAAGCVTREIGHDTPELQIM